MKEVYKRELERTEYLHHYLGLADIAHVIMTMEEKVIPEKPGKKLLTLLLQMPEHLGHKAEYGDMYSNRVEYLERFDKEIAGWLGVGRARRDATVVAYTLHMRKLLLGLMDALIVTGEQVRVKAAEHQETVMPDYTYLQQAQPTTLGHYLLGFVYPVKRAVAHVKESFISHDRFPGGIGSVNGSRLPVNRWRLAELLGFGGMVTHTRDAMWQHDLAVYAGTAVTSALIGLARLANDLQVFASQEFGFVRLADEHCRPSVIMPNKRNPYTLTFVRKVASETVGQLVSLCTAGLTGTGQPDSRVLCQEIVPGLIEGAIDAVQIMGQTMAGMSVNVSAMEKGAGREDLAMTDAVEIIMQQEEVSYREACNRIAQRTKNEKDWTSPQWSGKREWELSPDSIIATRTQLGGAAKKPMDLMLRGLYHWYIGSRNWPRERLKDILQDERALVTLAEKMSGE